MITDLETLVAQCRSENAKLLFSESLRCYFAGAYRAAMVMCWNAIIVDFADKLEELAQSGEADARQRSDAYRRAMKANDLPFLLGFEKDLSKSAVEMQMITESERRHLERIREDRNKAAHPDSGLEGEVAEVSSELVRTHLVHSAHLMLSRSPHYSARASDLIEKWLRKPNTAQTIEQCEEWLKLSGIRRIRSGSTGKLADYLVKQVLFELDHDTALKNLKMAAAFHRCDIALWTSPFHDKASKSLIRCYEEWPEHAVIRILHLIATLPSLDSAIKKDLRDRISHFLQSQTKLKPYWAIALQTTFKDTVYSILQPDIEFLRKLLIEDTSRIPVLTWAIKIYGSAKTYQSAGEIGQDLAPYAHEIASSRGLIEALGRAIKGSPNNSIAGSGYYGSAVTGEILKHEGGTELLKILHELGVSTTNLVPKQAG